MKPHNVAMTNDYLQIPFLIGAVGHRDLVDSELPAIRDLVAKLLREIRERYADARPTLLCSMAEGADLLIAEVALELGIAIVAMLPFPADVCRADLTSALDRDRFDRICARAEVLELPAPAGASNTAVSESHQLRDQQFQLAGNLLARDSALLIAIWDGKATTHHAGTARVVAHRRRGVSDDADMAAPRPAPLMAQDNDLIYEIRCSRRGAAASASVAATTAAATAAPNNPAQLQARFVTHEASDKSSDDALNVGDWPPSLRDTLERIAEFNRDAAARAQHILQTGHRLALPSPYPMPERLEYLDGLFTAADWLGARFRRRYVSALRLRYSLWAVMATLLVAFQNEPQSLFGLSTMTASVLVVAGMFAALAVLARRAHWHRKYLDYRALAEGLRVEYYWEIAGLRRESVSEFAHDSFLQNQDVELQWIRIAMRAVSFRLAFHPARNHAAGFSEAFAQWIGDDDPVNGSGQFLFYATRRRQLEKRLQREAFWRRALKLLIIGLAAAFVIDLASKLAGVALLSGNARDALLWCLALLTVYAAIFDDYTEKADRGLVRQYRYMHGTFALAARELRAAQSENQQLAILHALGHACLAEHAQWILANRDRHIEGMQW